MRKLGKGEIMRISTVAPQHVSYPHHLNIFDFDPHRKKTKHEHSGGIGGNGVELAAGEEKDITQNEEYQQPKKDAPKQEATESDGGKKKKKKKKKKEKEKKTPPSQNPSSSNESPTDPKIPQPPAPPPTPTVPKPRDPTEPRGSPAPTFPYPVDPSDHCESPEIAYAHVSEILKSCIPNNDNPTIYDPYYCDGGVITRLANLGFTNVLHSKVDCYSTWSSNSVGRFDVVVTNPPYSEGHVERMMEWVMEGGGRGRSWFLLMPQYVHKHEYYLVRRAERAELKRRLFLVFGKSVWKWVGVWEGKGGRND